MKLFATCFFLVYIFSPVFTIAQLQDPDYINLVTSDKSDDANKLIAILEKKYPNNGYVLMQKGYVQLMLENDVNNALITLSKAVVLLPDNDELLTTRGTAFFRKGLVDKAIPDQEKAISINPKKAMYYSKLGNYQFSQGNYETALATFLKGISVNPSTADIYWDAFATYYKLDRYDDALELFSKGLTDPQIDQHFLRCHWGKLLINFKKFNLATRQYELVFTSKEPHMFAEDYHNASVAHYKNGNPERANFFIDIAIKKEPYNTTYLTNRASYAMDAKDWATVIIMAERALAEDENHVLANMYMALGLKWGRNDLEKSAAYERKAKELDAKQTNK